jgi:nicotinamide riboside kinase
MLDWLEKVEQAIENMSSEEFNRIFNESKVTEEEASQYAELERMILGTNKEVK